MHDEIEVALRCGVIKKLQKARERAKKQAQERIHVQEYHDAVDQIAAADAYFMLFYIAAIKAIDFFGVYEDKQK